MIQTLQFSELLQNGFNLDRDEFLARWQALPHLKHAELIGGVVHMPSPVSREHGVMEAQFAALLNFYAIATPGIEVGTNTTWLMGEDAPQPDCYLRILPDHGGQSKNHDGFPQGAPELAVEIAVSSVAIDLHQKRTLYEVAGVQEYLVVLMKEKEIRWHSKEGNRFVTRNPTQDGMYQSLMFPGLWLSATAFLQGNMAEVIDVMQQGLQTPEHATFVEHLKKHKQTD